MAANEMYTYPGQKEVLAQEIKRNGPGRNMADGPPDHLNVYGMVNVAANDVKQLLEELTELRARLAPVLKEEPPSQPRRAHEAQCALAAEIGQVHLSILAARELVEKTLMQLDF